MSKEAETPKIIGNKSQGYNYKYTSLGDLVLAGVVLPPMRVAVLVNGEQEPILANGQPIEYIEAFVGNEWIRGARIVVPSGNKMNEAQAYGSALTYARRYTALTVLGLACDDDNKIEVHSKEEAEAQQIENITKELKELYAQTSGKNFDEWVKNCGGISIGNFPAMKTKLKQQITKEHEAEKEKKDE